jgi:hypothetical protein
MTFATKDDAASRELSIEELDSVVAGEWSWGDFAKAVGAGAVGGALGGAAVAPPAAIPGAIGGGLIAGIGYCISQL